MNKPLAALGGTVAYFVVGGVVFGLVPVLANEFRAYFTEWTIVGMDIGLIYKPLATAD
jgi:hypothetical protein